MKKMSEEAMREANGGYKWVAYCWTCKENGISGWRSSTSGVISQNRALRQLDMHTDGDTRGHNITYAAL